MSSNKMALDALTACPFCGKTNTLIIGKASDVFTEPDECGDPLPYMHTESYAVTCDASKPDGPGGCGASGGYKLTEAEAVSAWNARAAIAALEAEPQPKEGATDGLTPEQVRKVCADAERFLGATTNVIDFGLIGSAAWLPQPKDVDYIVLIEDSDERGPDFSVTAFCNALLPQGFENCGDYEMAMNGWNAVRRDDLNLIVTAVEDSYHAYRKAMIVCQALNLTDKKDRRMVCRILRDDLSLDEAKDKWNTDAQIEAAALPATPPKD